jgi:hypothetical protein
MRPAGRGSHPSMKRHKNAFAILTKPGGSVSTWIMSWTVGGLVCLLFLQGSFFWPTEQHSRSTSIQFNDRQSMEGKLKWDTQRQKFLQEIQKSSHLCTELPRRSTTTAKRLWTEYIGAIIAASQHPDDTKFMHEEWTKTLLSELPPYLLQTAVEQQTKTIPDLTRIVHIAQKRLQDPESAPPLRIAVVGGTFAEGESCSAASVSIPEGSVMANPTFCAWPYRLQAFLNTLLGVDWVEVTNLSEEGTDTGFMIPLVRNWIYPSRLIPHGPDIIINAYGQYDYETYGDGDVLDWSDTIQFEMNSFLRAVEVSHPCGEAPLVIHLDDVGVTLNKDIFKIYHKEAYLRVMKADRQKTDFAMAGHMAVTWVVAYAILDATLQFCGNEKSFSQKAPRIIAESCQDPSTGHSSCPFAVFASPQGTVTRVTEFQRYLKSFIVSNDGWEVLSDMSTGWSRKTGLVAIKAKASMILRVRNINKEVRYLHVMTLKSNVESWMIGKAQFRIAIILPENPDQPIQTSFLIDGIHQTNRKDPEFITHHYNMAFGNMTAPIGSDIMMSVELVEGSSFKIFGIMLCS